MNVCGILCVVCIYYHIFRPLNLMYVSLIFHGKNIHFSRAIKKDRLAWIPKVDKTLVRWGYSLISQLQDITENMRQTVDSLNIYSSQLSAEQQCRNDPMACLL